MKIFKIQICNYRLLKCFLMDIEKELSLVIGKNNTGKTSILSVLSKFLGQEDKYKFSFDDFNIEFKSELKTIIENPNEVLEENFNQLGIKLNLYIEYDERDNLSNISRVMMDLDPDNNVIVLGFEYILNFQNYLRLRNDYQEFSSIESTRQEVNADYKQKTLYDYLRHKHEEYFIPQKKSFKYDQGTKSVDSGNYIDLIKEGISTKDIINFKFISAKRDVNNKEIDKTLSGQTSKIYNSTEASDEQSKAVEDFKERLCKTDGDLSTIYKSLFSTIIKKVKDFGGMKINETEIEIISTLEHRELLEGNTTVVYKHDDDNKLPEHYNGLGYMNLISMIFEIHILVQKFKREKDKNPADINLLFIEEPEAHTHPQMQYVFIKNIKKLLKEGIKQNNGEEKNLQSIISTHSSCIVADSEFDDIKYLKKEGCNSVIAKNLKDLQMEYEVGTTQYQFLKQYLTINRAEIFFADKAILIEGDTERILIPTLMRKIDIEEEKENTSGEEDKYLPLLSQNISIIEVGAYSQIFEKFIDFLGIKSLIITDLDAVDDNGKKCEVSKGIDYSNDAISFFFNKPSLSNLIDYNLSDKIFHKVDNAWTNCEDGCLCVVYQIAEKEYNARSFEDAFIHINRDFILTHKDSFKGLKNKNHFADTTKNAYNLASECIKKKTHFALDIVYHSDEDFNNWQIPTYIKEGLLWLKQD